MNFHLKDAKAVHPRDETWERRLARAADSDEQQVTLRLAEDAVDAQDVVEHFIKQYQWHIQLLLVEHLQDKTVTDGLLVGA